MSRSPTVEAHRRSLPALLGHVRLVVGVVVVASVVGCGSGPTPPVDLDATGTVVLPAGSPLVLTQLRAMGPFGQSSVASQGEFTVPMAVGGTGLVGVATSAGDLVLMGFVDTGTDDGVVSAASTAAVLLYLAVGGPFMPGPVDHVLDLIAADPELASLVASVTTILAADPLALATGDEDLVAAVLAARDAIASRNAGPTHTGTSGAGLPGQPANRSPGAMPEAVQGSGNILITDPGVRGGFDMLISDDGFGVRVQNTLRRPARLLLYQTGTKSQEGPVNEFTTGQPVGEPLMVPPTRSINLFLALEDALGGGSALAPVESESVTLPLVTGTTRTYYTGVLLTPSLVPGATPPIFTDSRFFPFRPQWDEIIDDLQYETWWTSLMFPLMSSLAFGVTSQVAYASVAAQTQGVKGITAPLLAGEGITNPLSGDRARAMIRALEEAALGADGSYFYSLVEHTRSAMNLGQVPQSSLANARAYMGTLAKAAGVLAVVDALLTSADVVAMLHDMGGNGPAEEYNPVRLQTRAEIHPQEGQVQRLVAPSQVFNVVIDEPLDGGTYLYRWSTTGEYGFISDYLQEGDTFDSTSDEVFYLANEPAVITPELFDEITVEVYLDDGSGTIGAGAEPVTVASATVVGKERRDLIMGQYEVVTGSYPSGGTTRHCIAAYVTFERQPDATEYDVHAFNFYDPFYYGGAFGATVYEGSHLPTYTPPCDGNSPVVLGNEVYLFLSGGHGPDPGDAGWLNGRFAGMIVEVTVTY